MEQTIVVTGASLVTPTGREAADPATLRQRMMRLGVARLGLCETTFTIGSLGSRPGVHVAWAYRMLADEQRANVIAGVEDALRFALGPVRADLLTVLFEGEEREAVPAPEPVPPGVRVHEHPH